MSFFGRSKPPEQPKQYQPTELGFIDSASLKKHEVALETLGCIDSISSAVLALEDQIDKLLTASVKPAQNLGHIPIVLTALRDEWYGPSAGMETLKNKPKKIGYLDQAAEIVLAFQEKFPSTVALRDLQKELVAVGSPTPQDVHYDTIDPESGDLGRPKSLNALVNIMEARQTAMVAKPNLPWYRFLEKRKKENAVLQADQELAGATTSVVGGFAERSVARDQLAQAFVHSHQIEAMRHFDECLEELKIIIALVEQIVQICVDNHLSLEQQLVMDNVVDVLCRALVDPLKMHTEVSKIPGTLDVTFNPDSVRERINRKIDEMEKEIDLSVAKLETEFGGMDFLMKGLSHKVSDTDRENIALYMQSLQSAVSRIHERLGALRNAVAEADTAAKLMSAEHIMSDPATSSALLANFRKTRDDIHRYVNRFNSRFLEKKPEPTLPEPKSEIPSPEPKRREIRVENMSFPYDTAKAREYGFIVLEIKAHPAAQAGIDMVISHDPRFQTKGKFDIKKLQGYWNVYCPDLPNFPRKSSWYMKALYDGKITETMGGDVDASATRLHKPRFGTDTTILVLDFPDFNFDIKRQKQSAISPSTKKIMKALFGKEDVTSIPRHDANFALWSDHDNRVQSPKARAIIQELAPTENPDDLELRLIRQDEYARLAKKQNWGNFNISTHFDGYFQKNNGSYDGLVSGFSGDGGAEALYVSPCDTVRNDYAVRLVLSRRVK